jgi:hypothetical protein
MASKPEQIFCSPYCVAGICVFGFGRLLNIGSITKAKTRTDVHFQRPDFHEINNNATEQNTNNALNGDNSTSAMVTYLIIVIGIVRHQRRERGMEGRGEEGM